MRTLRFTRSIFVITALVVLCGGAIIGPPLGIVPAAAQAPSALSEAQDVNGQSGVVAEIVQCKRDNGMLSIRLRLRNTGSADVKGWRMVSDNIDQFYVLASNKKYLVLRDSDKTPLASAFTGSYGTLDISIPAGGAYVWYAKYPAPPDDVKKISFYTPLTTPFEDVPVSQ